MLPSLALAVGVEKLRDGGSLCAMFQGTNGSMYWLLLPIEYEEGIATSYSEPLIVERPFGAERMQISWQHAEIFLRQIEQLLPSMKDHEFVQLMHKVIRSEGRVKPN